MPTYPYCENIEKETVYNKSFRKVVYTGKYSQLVFMSLIPGEDIGLETHNEVDQFFRFEQGVGQAVVSGKEYDVSDGIALLVPAGQEHNIINTGNEDLKFYTLYSPANHIDGRVHETKADALADVEDEAFGH